MRAIIAGLGRERLAAPGKIPASLCLQLGGAICSASPVQKGYFSTSVDDGEMGPRSVWIRENGLFSSVYDFDWDAWDNDGKASRLSFEIVPEIVVKNGAELMREKLPDKIMEKGVQKRTAYAWISRAVETRLIKVSPAGNIVIVA